MTLKEKVAEMEPEKVGHFGGGVKNYPSSYDYLNVGAGEDVSTCIRDCEKCWNREFVQKVEEEMKTKIDKAIEEVAYILDCLTAYRSITEKGCCNDCKFKRSCKCCPKPGEVVRYNCPLYEREV